MRVFRSKSNQWGVGIGLARSTIYSSHRWQFWITYGYRSIAWSWKMNPNAPRAQS